MLSTDDPNPLPRPVAWGAAFIQFGWPLFIVALVRSAIDGILFTSLPLLAALLAINTLLTWLVMQRLDDILTARSQDPGWKYMAFLGLVGILIVLALPAPGELRKSGGFEVFNVKGVPIAESADRMIHDTLYISREPLNAAYCIGLVTDGAAGGVAVFIGTTRAEATPDSKRQLIALDYQAYTEMADRQLRDIAKQAREQWPIVRLVIAHRIGRVPLSHPSVIIAVSTPHRSDAFAACRWIIDTLKSSAAIWKKEVWSDGTTTWVEPTTAPSPPV